MSLSYFLQFISGIGLFLSGMNMLSESLGKLAGEKSQTLLSSATSAPFKGMLLGAGVTSIIQSSTATTLMTMSLVDAGVLNVYRAVPVVMGANIGTTATAQFLSLADIKPDNNFLEFMKPQIFAPFFILIGSIEKLFFKKREILDSASLFTGVGIMFFGMELTEESLRPLGESTAVRTLPVTIENPFLCFLCGIAITIMLQSSSVSIGILQTLSSTGVLSFGCAVPLILGINAGKALPETFASLGTGLNTKIMTLSSLFISLVGCLIFSIIFFLVPEEIYDFTATKASIANFHTLFNISTTLVLLPFFRFFIRLSEKILNKN